MVEKNFSSLMHAYRKQLSSFQAQFKQPDCTFEALLPINTCKTEERPNELTVLAHNIEIHVEKMPAFTFSQFAISLLTSFELFLCITFNSSLCIILGCALAKIAALCAFLFKAFRKK